MDMLVISLCVVIIAILYLYIKEIINNKNLNKKYNELNSMLTQSVIDIVDTKKKLADIEEDYIIQKDMAKEVQSIQQQMRLLKHDMKNHTFVIMSYLDENKIDEAKKYIGELLDKLNRMYSYINVGNALLNYILNNKLSKAKEDGIEIKAEIENLAFDYMNSVDFSSLLNNVLDNAICAANNSDRKYLEMKIFSKKGMDFIVVKNSISMSVLENNPELNTTKEEKGHGLGMKQIRSIVDKYNGTIDIYEEDLMFIISFMFAKN